MMADKCALDAFSVASKTSSRCDVDVIVQICQRLPIQTYPNMYSPPSALMFSARAIKRPEWDSDGMIIRENVTNCIGNTSHSIAMR